MMDIQHKWRRAGFLYENGQGVALNPSEAIKWYERAAAQNDTDAIDSLKRLGKRL